MSPGPLAIQSLFSVAGKTAVITGGSRGIGEMIARAYVANGAHVILTARKAAELEALAAELGPAATPIPADLSQMAEIDRLAAEIGTLAPRSTASPNSAGTRSWT